MTAGKLDQRITLQAFAEVSDGGGGVTKTWADLATTPTVWANVTAGSGREAFLEDRTTATAMVMFTIRNRSDLDERGRIVWGGENFNIREIKREGTRAMYLRIMAERGVAQ